MRLGKDEHTRGAGAARRTPCITVMSPIWADWKSSVKWSLLRPGGAVGNEVEAQVVVDGAAWDSASGDLHFGGAAS